MKLYSIDSYFLTTMVGGPVLIFYKIDVLSKISVTSSKMGSQLGSNLKENIKSHITMLGSGFYMDLQWLSLVNTICRSCNRIQNQSQRSLILSTISVVKCDHTENCFPASPSISCRHLCPKNLSVILEWASLGGLRFMKHLLSMFQYFQILLDMIVLSFQLQGLLYQFQGLLEDVGSNIKLKT
jgi:hypothetical protein